MSNLDHKRTAFIEEKKWILIFNRYLQRNDISIKMKLSCFVKECKSDIYKIHNGMNLMNTEDLESE